MRLTVAVTAESRTARRRLGAPETAAVRESAGASYPGRSSRRDSSVDRHADMSSDTRVDNVKIKRRAAAAISVAAAAPPPVPAPDAVAPPPVIGELAGGVTGMGAESEGLGGVRRSAGTR
jgi:hypothetical protein